MRSGSWLQKKLGAKKNYLASKRTNPYSSHWRTDCALLKREGTSIVQIQE